jgi:hypothetical protein
MSTQDAMTWEELADLPATVGIVTAGRAFGLGSSVAYQLAKAGEFPCRVLRVGKKYRVARADLFRALGMEPNGDTAA